MKLSLLSLFIVFIGLNIHAQDEIYLNNPSLEDTPRFGKVPAEWDNCGFEEETPVDVHPDGNFGVNKAAKYGKTYVGMVVRDNETWECFGQALSNPLKAGECYTIAFAATMSTTYMSTSRLTNELTNFDTPSVIRLWAGYTDQEGYQLLAESDPIDNIEWKEFELSFTPNKDYDYFYIEAYYTPGSEYFYNGNVLIDYFSPIVPCVLLKHGAIVRDFEDN